MILSGVPQGDATRSGRDALSQVLMNLRGDATHRIASARARAEGVANVNCRRLPVLGKLDDLIVSFSKDDLAD